MNNYTEYLVIYEDATYNIRKTYEQVQALAAEREESKIYGAAYFPSGIAGMLQRKWELIAE